MATPHHHLIDPSLASVTVVPYGTGSTRWDYLYDGVTVAYVIRDRDSQHGAAEMWVRHEPHQVTDVFAVVHLLSNLRGAGTGTSRFALVPHDTTDIPFDAANRACRFLDYVEVMRRQPPLTGTGQ